jgi:SAM-dependent methyltransferase
MKIETETVQKTENNLPEGHLPAYQVVVVCPQCKEGHLQFPPVHNRATCSHCDMVYPARTRFVDLLYGPDERIPASIPMEWGWMAEIYETRLWRRGILNSVFFRISFEKEYNTLVEAMNITNSESVLDVACGPGMYARPLAKKLTNGTVVGLDISMPMLNYASAKSEKEGLDNLLLIHGSAKDLPFPEYEFDVVNCCGALHLFPQVSTVKGFYTVLKPGGRVTVATAKQALQSKWTKKLSDYFHKKGWVKYFYQDELETLFSKAGFTDIKFLHTKGSWFLVSAVKPE